MSGHATSRRLISRRPARLGHRHRPRDARYVVSDCQPRRCDCRDPRRANRHHRTLSGLPNRWAEIVFSSGPIDNALATAPDLHRYNQETGTREAIFANPSPRLQSPSRCGQRRSARLRGGPGSMARTAGPSGTRVRAKRLRENWTALTHSGTCPRRRRSCRNKDYSIYLSAGYPDLSLLPAEQLARACRRAVKLGPASALS